MILTVTLNAALDVTYEVDQVVPDASHRVRTVRERAGGKGINVARVLHAMRREAICMGLIGGSTGDRIAADLAVAGMPSGMWRIAGESRRTVSVVSAATGGATLFNEPGPRVTDDEWRGFLDAYREHAAGSRVVVLSGSLPPGVPEDAYAQLTSVAHDAGAQVIVDADGMALARSLGAGPDVVKPNAAELVAATGLTATDAAMGALRDAGARAVVASFGPAGIRALAPAGAWRAWSTRPIATVNPTGAGDALAAALAAGHEDHRDWPSMLTDGVAWSAAAVMASLAGDLDPGTPGAIGSHVRVEIA